MKFKQTRNSERKCRQTEEENFIFSTMKHQTQIKYERNRTLHKSFPCDDCFEHYAKQHRKTFYDHMSCYVGTIIRRNEQTNKKKKL